MAMNDFHRLMHNIIAAIYKLFDVYIQSISHLISIYNVIHKDDLHLGEEGVFLSPVHRG